MNACTVSIRAPRTGRKGEAEEPLPLPALFQSAPRVRGERLSLSCTGPFQLKFQSAPRVRGERCRTLATQHGLGVSIRAPRTGRKSSTVTSSRMSHMFQSAPRVRGESDDCAANLCGSMGFQSAPRVRGERACHLVDGYYWKVSIRAPRTGRKPSRYLNRHHDRLRFQSAPRVRGESRGRTTPRKQSRCFNPRPAYGAKVSDRLSKNCLSLHKQFRERPSQGDHTDGGVGTTNL